MCVWCVLAREEGDRTRLSFTKLCSSMKGWVSCREHWNRHTHMWKHSLTTALEMINVGLSVALSSRESTWRHRDPVFTFLTGESGSWGYNGAVSRDKDGWCAQMVARPPGIRLMLLWVSLWANGKCPDLPLWILWSVATPNDRWFIILVINLDKAYIVCRFTDLILLIDIQT